MAKISVFMVKLNRKILRKVILMIGFPPKGNSIKEQVLNNIIDKIQYLKLLPGEKIDENALDSEIGASRTPRREAMMLLEMEGLVNVYPQKGTYVTLIDLNVIKEIIYLRLTLELRIFSELADKGIKTTPYVEKYLLMQEFYAKSDELIEFIKNDYLFHRELFHLAGHEELWNMIEGKLIHTTRFRILGWTIHKQAFKDILIEHKKIVTCIDSQNYNGLKTALITHHDYDLKKYADILLKEKSEYFKHNK